MIRFTQQNAAADESAEILASNRDLVPTASQKSVPAETVTASEVVTWQTAMKRAIRSSSVLRRALDLPSAGSPDAEADFPTFVPLEFLSRIRRGDPDDPLLRQVLPIVDEDDRSAAGFVADPVGDLNASVGGGVLHKYHGRALVVTTGACGVHCRYCFRREFPYSESTSQSSGHDRAIEYLRSAPGIDEVLLSGGDPLTLADDKLDDLLSQLESIPHLRRVRFHTRMPIVIPQRINDTVVKRLHRSRLTTWFVVHANHAHEIDAAVIGSLSKLIDAGIPVLNQAVLLRGVNDTVDALADLCTKLVDHRVMPYYLHQLDRVRGASHFEVPIETGKQLIADLRARLPGYAVPTYVTEQSGQTSKTPL